MGAKGSGATFGGVEVALWEVEGSGQVDMAGFCVFFLTKDALSMQS